MGNAQDVVDMLEADTKDEIVGAAVRWHSARTHRQAVEDAGREIGLDSEQIDRIDRCRAIELEEAENLAGKVVWALRYGP